MQKVVLVARLLLGLVFTVFGLNVFVQFLPAPEMSEAAGSFYGALLGSGYLVPLLGATKLTAGIFLLAGILVPLALTLLAPIVVNIVLFHVFLSPLQAIHALSGGGVDLSKPRRDQERER